METVGDKNDSYIHKHFFRDLSAELRASDVRRVIKDILVTSKLSTG